jgi:hypothetical protein
MLFHHSLLYFLGCVADAETQNTLGRGGYSILCCDVDF